MEGTFQECGPRNMGLFGVQQNFQEVATLSQNGSVISKKNFTVTQGFKYQESNVLYYTMPLERYLK